MSKIQILDHGYLEYVEHWGSDERIIEAARMSTAKGFLGWGPFTCPECNGLGDNNVTYQFAKCIKCDGTGKVPGDEKLLRYLWDNRHETPFEMAGLTIETMAPIMVFREWHRHRVPFGYNEMSARYVPLPNDNYVPTVDRCMRNSTTNRQAGVVAGADELTPVAANRWLAELEDFYEYAERVYQRGLSAGIPKELARLCIPVGRYSRMRATSNLRGWLGFLKLRMHKKAQEEIRVFAEAVGIIISQKFPRTWALFVEGKK